jgi:hypothetical protein
MMQSASSSGFNMEHVAHSHKPPAEDRQPSFGAVVVGPVSGVLASIVSWLSLRADWESSVGLKTEAVGLRTED